jgi:hypothetical protein
LHNFFVFLAVELEKPGLPYGTWWGVLIHSSTLLEAQVLQKPPPDAEVFSLGEGGDFLCLARYPIAYDPLEVPISAFEDFHTTLWIGGEEVWIYDKDRTGFATNLVVCGKDRKRAYSLNTSGYLPTSTAMGQGFSLGSRIMFAMRSGDYYSMNFLTFLTPDCGFFCRLKASTETKFPALTMIEQSEPGELVALSGEDNNMVYALIYEGFVPPMVLNLAKRSSEVQFVEFATLLISQHVMNEGFDLSHL